MRTHYDVLGVKHNASADEIGSAYRFLASKFHPDVNLGKESEARRRFLEVQEAFDVLSDEGRRMWYDAKFGMPVELPPVATAQMEPPPLPPAWSIFDEPIVIPEVRKTKPIRRQNGSPAYRSQSAQRPVSPNRRPRKPEVNYSGAILFLGLCVAIAIGFVAMAIVNGSGSALDSIASVWEYLMQDSSVCFLVAGLAGIAAIVLTTLRFGGRRN